MNGDGDVLLMPVIDHGRISEPSAHLLNHVVRSACDKKIGGSSCSQGVPTVVPLARPSIAALDTSDQSVVRQGLGPEEPCPAEAAGEELQRGACWLAELVEVEPTAHQGHCVRRGAVLEKDLEGPPPSGGSWSARSVHSWTYAQDPRLRPVSAAPILSRGCAHVHVEDRDHQEIVGTVQVAKWQEAGGGAPAHSVR